ncbi:MAG: hypothetical protein IT565_13655 [Rhodospirillales bacterium]|nr:hypothetical protein [Rhodospirillales bacterium]
MSRNGGPIDVVFVVWGEAYCRLFIDVALSSLLAPGNLPMVAGRRDCRLVIHTCAIGQAMIPKAPIFSKLSALVPIELALIESVAGDKYAVSSRRHAESVRRAASRGATVFLLGPDAVFSDGLFAAILARLDQGKRAVVAPGIRLDKSRAVERLDAFRNADGALIISPRDMMGLTVECPHPTNRLHMVMGDDPEFEPSGMLWPVTDQGYVFHCFHLHPLAFCPPAQGVDFANTIDDDMLTKSGIEFGDIHVVADSDELTLCEISDPAQRFPAPARRGLPGVIDWAGATKAVHRHFVRHTLLLHRFDLRHPAWLTTTIDAARYVADVLCGVGESEERRARVSLERLMAEHAMTRDMAESLKGIVVSMEARIARLQHEAAMRLRKELERQGAIPSEDAAD